MKITICAVGRLRRGPELSLVTDYIDRFDKIGRNMGLGPTRVIEVEDKKKAGISAEGELLARQIPASSFLCTLDERGVQLSSPQFADKMENWRDQGQQGVAFVIGGADGIAQSLRAQADASLSFGKMVWPHMLVRVMLAEQLYRTATILAGAPYHRV